MKRFKVSSEKLEGLKKLSSSELFQIWGEWLEFPEERLDHIEQDEMSISIIDRGINEGSSTHDGSTMFYTTPSIKELKKELELTNADLAGFFGMNQFVYANSSAKERYEDAMCSLYAFAKSKAGEAKRKSVCQQCGKHNDMNYEICSICINECRRNSAPSKFCSGH